MGLKCRQSDQANKSKRNPRAKSKRVQSKGSPSISVISPTECHIAISPANSTHCQAYCPLMCLAAGSCTYQVARGTSGDSRHIYTCLDKSGLVIVLGLLLPKYNLAGPIQFRNVKPQHCHAIPSLAPGTLIPLLHRYTTINLNLNLKRKKLKMVMLR